MRKKQNQVSTFNTATILLLVFSVCLPVSIFLLQKRHQKPINFENITIIEANYPTPLQHELVRAKTNVVFKITDIEPTFDCRKKVGFSIEWSSATNNAIRFYFKQSDGYVSGSFTTQFSPEEKLFHNKYQWDMESGNKHLDIVITYPEEKVLRYHYQNKCN